MRTTALVVPFHNEVDRLSSVIRALRNQASHEVEIVFVDNGSTDGSVDLVRELEEVASSGVFEAISEQEVLEMVRTSGVLDEVRLRARAHADRAVKRSDAFPPGPERDALVRASELLLDRGA